MTSTVFTWLHPPVLTYRFNVRDRVMATSSRAQAMVREDM